VTKQNTSKKIKTLSTSAVLTSVALIFSYVEVLVPISIGIPGIKLGLANIVIVMALYTLGPKYAAIINLVRICLSALMFGSIYSMVYALSGGIISFLIMLILKSIKKEGNNVFSIIGVSMAGGVFHNFGQLLASAVVLQTVKILYYFPVLTIAGLITGIVTGFISSLALKNIRYFSK